MKKQILGLVAALMLLASPAWGAATLNWQDNSTTETGFRVYRANGIGASYQPIADLPAGTTTYTDPAGQAGHCWRVTAFNDAGESQPSNSGCLLLVVPTTPGVLSIQ